MSVKEEKEDDPSASGGGLLDFLNGWSGSAAEAEEEEDEPESEGYIEEAEGVPVEVNKVDEHMFYQNLQARLMPIDSVLSATSTS